MGRHFRALLWSAPFWQTATDNWARTTRWSWIGKYLFFGWLFKNYDVTFIPINKQLEEKGSTIVPKQLIADLIRSSAHRRILPLCLCRIGCSCKTYPMGIGCIFLGEATKQMHPSLGRPATVEQALDHLDKAIEAGLIPQIGKVDPDAFWSGVKMKDWDKFLTLCFCCTCCCIAMRNTDRWSGDMKSRMHSLEGLSIDITKKCNGCGKCEKKCFAKAIYMESDRAVINKDKCKGCGICVDSCPQKAITIKISDSSRMVKALHERIKSYGDITK